MTVGQMTFLGMTGFNSDWIDDYAVKVAPYNGQQMQEADLTYFADGLCFRDHTGYHAGFAVSQKKPDGPFITAMATARKAEITVLTEACRLAFGKKADIYMDSAYAHGVCHLFGAVWKQRGFKKTDGSSIQHMSEITNLLTAMMRTHALAIIKCPAHRKGNNFVIKGNNTADKAAREASGCSSAIMAPVVTIQPHVTHHCYAGQGSQQ